MRPVLRELVSAHVTVVLPLVLPVVLSTQLERFTVLAVHDSDRRVFQVVPPSEETWKVHWLLFVAARSRVCTLNST